MTKYLLKFGDVLSEENNFVLLNDFRNCDLDVTVPRHLDDVQHFGDVFLTNVVDLCHQQSLSHQH